MSSFIHITYIFVWVMMLLVIVSALVRTIISHYFNEKFNITVRLSEHDEDSEEV